LTEVEQVAGEEPRIRPRPIEREMKESYLDYAMSVIVGRALPDVRDGLKPVHRRILYAMNEMGLTHNKPYKKSARVVGEVLGKYHPHGDMAVYDALVRMAQDFSLRYPLIDGQGNFGSIDGDSPAAMRYTECRLSPIAEEMLKDIDKDTVDFMDNFDASLKEPVVLPGAFPNLLVNGSSGIAVGMATNIPPHNLSEVVDAIVALIDNPDLEPMDLMEYIRGPDFPTGGIIYGLAGVQQAYHTGRGQIKVRARAHFEEDKKGGKKRIIVTELPYMVNKAHLLETIAKLVKDKKIDGITDLRDESDRQGMRVVIELRRDVIPEVVLNQLYAHTQMETTFGVINIALVDGKPRVLNLKEMISEFIKHRQRVVRRRTEYELRKAEERSHILEGLLTALENLDEVIRIIRRSPSADEASQSLMKRFLLTAVQAKAILDMRLHRLTGLERQAVVDEHRALQEKIKEYREILSDEKNILRIIKEESLEIKRKYGDERRTEIEENPQEISYEDLIAVEDVVVTITNTGYIKRTPVATYRAQHRGGVGLKGMETKEEDYVVDAFVTSTHDYILFFTNFGRVYWLKAYKIPPGGRHSRGKAIVNLLPRLADGEKIQAAIPVKEFSEDKYLVFATRRGKVKKTPLSSYSRPRITGIRAINLVEGDELVDVKITDGTKEIILATRNGMAVRFHESEIRPMGRTAAGVRGIRLRDGDEVVAMAVVDEDDVLLTITENGYGKRTPVREYRKTHRGGVGVITIKTAGRNGPVVNVLKVRDDDYLLLTTKQGMIIRIPVNTIRMVGRNTMGVRVMRLKPGDKLITAAKTPPPEEEESEEKNEDEAGAGSDGGGPGATAG